MSKYTEAIEFLEHLEGKDLEFSWTDSGITELLKARDLAVETLEIADRLEQMDVISNEEIYIKACRRYGCWESECPHRARDRFCSDLAEIFFDGYDQALADLRGEE